MPDSFLWRHEKVSGMLWTAMAWGKTKSLTHIEHRAGAVGWQGMVTTKFQSLFLNI